MTLPMIVLPSPPRAAATAQPPASAPAGGESTEHEPHDAFADVLDDALTAPALSAVVAALQPVATDRPIDPIDADTVDVPPLQLAATALAPATTALVTPPPSSTGAEPPAAMPAAPDVAAVELPADASDAPREALDVVSAPTVEPAPAPSARDAASRAVPEPATAGIETPAQASPGALAESEHSPPVPANGAGDLEPSTDESPADDGPARAFGSSVVPAEVAGPQPRAVASTDPAPTAPANQPVSDVAPEAQRPERIELQRVGNTRLGLDMSTDALGQVRIEAVDRSGGLELHLSAGEASTRALLREHAADLRAELHVDGVDVATLDVSSGRERSSPEPGGAPTDGTAGAATRSAPEPQLDDPAVEPTVADGRLDVRI